MGLRQQQSACFSSATIRTGLRVNIRDTAMSVDEDIHRVWDETAFRRDACAASPVEATRARINKNMKAAHWCGVIRVLMCDLNTKL